MIIQARRDPGTDPGTLTALVFHPETRTSGFHASSPTASVSFEMNYSYLTFHGCCIRLLFSFRFGEELETVLDMFRVFVR